MLLLRVWRVREFFCTGQRDSQDARERYITVGANFTVALHYKLKGTEKLRWKYNTDILFNGKADQFSAGNNRDISANGSLKLTNVKKSQAGTYSPEVYNALGKRVDNLTGIPLYVLDPVPKPKMTVKCEQTKVRFACTAQGIKDLSIKWLQDNTELKGAKKDTLVQDITEVKGSISCQISNQASSMTSNSAARPCQGSGGFPEKIMGISVWIFVGGGGGIVLVLIIITIVCCVWAKRKKRMQLKDEEELRLEWANPQQQQQQQQECRQHNRPPGHHHHHHGHHQQQQPAGHTGPRQHRPKQQRPRAPDPISGQPQPSPRRPAQTPRPVVNDDDEQPPPLPQPRKKAPKTPRM
ncbi:T-cell surface antigen CD2-like isoform X2 [Trachinotus anak]|uniref:T-cell surface antigen CD2-like isoform X2 n=1 Tax=Trachinotus anak TaxID=443729 RepID=UPI0039F24A76